MNPARARQKEAKRIKREPDDLEMMRRPDLWPVWPRLPVKRPRWDTGFLIEDLETQQARPTVYDWCTGEPVDVHDNLEGLYASGWTVD